MTNDNLATINKGVELLLRRKKKPECSKTFRFEFDKMVSLLGKEITVSFNFSFDIKKQFFEEKENVGSHSNNL